MDHVPPIIAPNILTCFSEGYYLLEGVNMQVYWLNGRTTGEATLVDADTVERVPRSSLGMWAVYQGPREVRKRDVAG